MRLLVKAWRYSIQPESRHPFGGSQELGKNLHKSLNKIAEKFLSFELQKEREGEKFDKKLLCVLKLCFSKLMAQKKKGFRKRKKKKRF
jgi:hypothetical protein